MSLNLPPNQLLKVTKGAWADVHYPAHVYVQVLLSPKDFFEPVDIETPRSCIPVGGKDFVIRFDANTGKMAIFGPTMFSPLSVTMNIEKEDLQIIFVGQLMQVSFKINSEREINTALSNIEYTIPMLLSLATGISIFSIRVEIAIGENFEARCESSVPPYSTHVLDDEERISNLVKGIKIFGIARNSARFTLACDYLRDAIYFNASYFEHISYHHSLIVILKCAQAIEVLFGGQRDSIRVKCELIGLDKDIIESQIIPITLVRNNLGSAHASSFIPDGDEVDILRRFAHQGVEVVQRLILHISELEKAKQAFLVGGVEQDIGKARLFQTMKQSFGSFNRTSKDSNRRALVVGDPRLK